MEQHLLQTIYRQTLNEAIQEPGENSLDFYLRLEMYCNNAYPINQYDVIYRFNRIIMQFVFGAHEETMANQTAEDIDKLMLYIMYEYGYI